MILRSVSLSDLVIDDEAAFSHIGLYGLLKQALLHSDHRFRTAPAGERLSWDRALFLNLTYFAGDAESSVLCDEHTTPDVIAHTAWHQVVDKALARVSPAGQPCAAALLFAEAIASAFDLYLVGRLFDHAPDCDFIASQVPILAEAADQAGLSEAGFASLMKSVSADPEGAFEDLRALLLDAGLSLYACADVDEAQAALESHLGHRFEPLLHHFQLSNWILHTRAHARPGAADPDDIIRRLDQELRGCPDSLEWLHSHWLADVPS
jgi:hypothetical protein